MSSLSDFVVHSSNGIDHEASLTKFTSYLKTIEAEMKTETSTIATAVNSVFDKYPGQAIPLPKLVHFSLSELNVQPETYKSLEEKTLKYVRANLKGSDSLFVSVKGQHGGTRRRTDLVSQ